MTTVFAEQDDDRFGNDEEEKMAPIDEKELALDRGFVVPHFNSFGHRFSPGPSNHKFWNSYMNNTMVVGTPPISFARK
ncbi:hypothetical protein HN51_027644 [Arachis hypogaea]